MSGYFNNLKYDGCSQVDQNRLNWGTQNYSLYLPSVMRPIDRVRPLGAGVFVDFYGPLNGRKIAQDSFLTGRGQPLSRCAGTEVNFLPEKLFSGNCDTNECCERTDLQSEYTKVKKGCNGISNTDTSSYSMFPGAFEKSHLGIGGPLRFFENTRILPEIISCPGPKSSYGIYNNSVPSLYV